MKAESRAWHRHHIDSPAPDRPEFSAALLDDGFDLAAVFDGAGHCRYLNPAGRRLLGVGDESDLASFDMDRLVAADDADRLGTEIRPTLAASQNWSGQILLQRPNGIEIPTRSTIRLHAGGTLTWVARDLTNDKAVMHRIAQRTFYDDVTHLPHRSLFLDKLDLSLRRLRDRTTPVSVLFVNLDRFKDKNDRFGLEVGNLLLKEVGRRLSRVLTEGRDTLARWGGDEFVVLREEIGGDTDAIILAERISGAFDEPFVVGGSRVFMTASIGIASASPGEVGTDELLRHADAACQFAKQRGGACHHFFDEEMRTRAWRRAEVEDNLRGATERGELVMHYQPEVLLRSNRIHTVEALIRWHHPEWGLVAPTEFIPIAETSNLILDIGDFVLAEGMAQCASWRQQFPDRSVVVALNVSARQFREDDFVERVAWHMATSGADPSLVCLEITESTLMDDLEEASGTLRRLKDLGVRLAIDDFGTGYSSLSYLRRFPVDILKVDQSFVAGLGHDPEDSAIVHAMISMGRALGLLTVAEGVETAHHLIELRELQCDMAQGYHFARPRPAEHVTRLLAAGDGWLSSNT